MKRFYSLILVVSIISLSSCSFLHKAKSNKDKVEKDSSHIVTDSVSTGAFKDKVDSATINLKDVQKEINSIKAEVVYTKYAFYIICVLVIIVLIIGYYYFKRIDKKLRQIKDIRFKVDNIENNTNTRIIKLEKVYSQLSKSKKKEEGANSNILRRSYEEQKVVSQQKKTPSYLKEGYTKLYNDNLFINIYDSNEEGCVFKIYLKDQDNGEFDLISLDKIKSRNGWEKVIDTERGGCSLEDATSYELKEKGKITFEKKDGDDKIFRITQNLRIKLKM